MADEFKDLGEQYVAQFQDLPPFSMFDLKEDCIDAMKQALRDDTPIEEPPFGSILT